MKKDTVEGYRENIFKEGVKRTLFNSCRGRVIYDNLSNYLYIHRYNQCYKKTRKLYNKYKGQRCFLVATGPSINQTNLDVIKDETLAGVNTSFKTGLDFDIYIVSDRVIWDVYSQRFLDMDTMLFLLYVASRHYLQKYHNDTDNVYTIRGINTTTLPSGFPSDISNGVYVYAHSVVYLSLQILFFLGFQTVYLIGCDCSYSQGHHFDGMKHVKDNRIQQDRNLEDRHWRSVIDGFKICKKIYEQDNREIINCTVGGNLEVFKRRKLEDVIQYG